MKRWFMRVSIYRKILASFLLVILIGTIFFMLPITANDAPLGFIDALFTAVSATCVTGLSTIVVKDQFNILGQILMLIMIQIGGLGLFTILASVTLAIQKRTSLNQKLIMKELVSLTSITGFRRMMNQIVRYTLLIEGIGTLLLCFVFVPEYGMAQGIFNALFTAVSAFCNAGFDNLGSSSLMAYYSNPLLCIVVMVLIVLGGLGFIVAFDVWDKWKKKKADGLSFKKFKASLLLHSKLVLGLTFLLITIPAILIFVLEFNNPMTLGNLSLGDKIINALFSSVTLRTAGFATLSMENFKQASSLIMMLGMFIGGSPGGTAGGIKTTTFLVLVMYIIGAMRGRNEYVVHKRTIAQATISRAFLVVGLNIFILFVGVFLLLISEDGLFLTVAFEAVSALATVGLSMGITASLTAFGKLVIVAMMFLGRVGIITFALSVLPKKKKSDDIHYVEGSIIVG